jgi:membrane protease YdiL (CAAX protease family)
MVNPIFEMVAGGDIFIIMLLFVLATTWAPIVEESIFRGALYRHLRGRLHWVAAGLLSGVLFAFMHDYGPLMVAPLIALGFMFAFMREWRGSIIAPMTAHFIHNFTLMAFMITFVQLIKDPV